MNRIELLNLNRHPIDTVVHDIHGQPISILMLGIDGVPLNEWCAQNLIVDEPDYLERMVPAQGWLYEDKGAAYAWNSLYPIRDGLGQVGQDNNWNVFTERDELSCVAPNFDLFV